MKNLLNTFMKHTCWLLILSVIFLGFVSCDQSTDPDPVSNAVITGNINLPEVAQGKVWMVVVDSDFNGDNGMVKYCSGNCAMDTIIGFQIENVPSGNYYVYAVVFTVSDGSQGPQPGDYWGIYGGTFPNDVPGSPNVNVAGSEVTLNIDLTVYVETIQPGEWSAVTGFGSFDMTINQESTHITQMKYNFSHFSCGGVTLSGTITVSSNPGWDITDREFIISKDIDPSPFSSKYIIIQGEFNPGGTSASGAWQAIFGSSTKSGSWNAVP